jgi:hypothetical protein
MTPGHGFKSASAGSSSIRLEGGNAMLLVLALILVLLWAVCFFLFHLGGIFIHVLLVLAVLALVLHVASGRRPDQLG